jgi:hypothetical protein
VLRIPSDCFCMAIPPQGRVVRVPVLETCNEVRVRRGVELELWAGALNRLVRTFANGIAP